MDLNIDVYIDGDIDLSTDAGQREMEAILRAIAYHAQIAFDQSQMYCPVVSGRLVRSGWLATAGEDIRFGYSADYAEPVERGRGKRGEKYYMKGRHFIRDGINEADRNFDNILKSFLDTQVGIADGEYIVIEEDPLEESVP